MPDGDADSKEMEARSQPFQVHTVKKKIMLFFISSLFFLFLLPFLSSFFFLWVRCQLQLMGMGGLASADVGCIEMGIRRWLGLLDGLRLLGRGDGLEGVRIGFDTGSTSLEEVP